MDARFPLESVAEPIVLKSRAASARDSGGDIAKQWRLARGRFQSDRRVAHRIWLTIGTATGNRVLVFDGQTTGSNRALTLRDYDLLETLVYDTAEHLMLGQADGSLALRFLGGRFHEDDNTAEFPDVSAAFGAGDLPIVGDWDADGLWTIGVYRPGLSTFYLRNTNTAGFPDLSIPYGDGPSGDKPVAGDWTDCNRSSGLPNDPERGLTIYPEGNSQCTFGDGMQQRRINFHRVGGWRWTGPN